MTFKGHKIEMKWTVSIGDLVTLIVAVFLLGVAYADLNAEDKSNKQEHGTFATKDDLNTVGTATAINATNIQNINRNLERILTEIRDVNRKIDAKADKP